MDMLSIRITDKDREYIELLCRAWGMNRSEVIRKAVEETAVRIRKQKKSKMDILREHSLVGCYADEAQKTTKSAIKASLKKKYGQS